MDDFTNGRVRFVQFRCGAYMLDALQEAKRELNK